MIIQKCDRCEKELPEQHWSYCLGENTQYYTFCKECLDDLKDMLDAFWQGRKEEFLRDHPTREIIGDKKYKYNIIGRVATANKPPEPEPYKPNALVRLFYWLFYKEVKVEE